MPEHSLDYAEDLDVLPADVPDELHTPRGVQALEEIAAAEAVRSLDELLARGRERGTVTQEEIMQLVPQAEENVDRLDEIMEALVKAGITVTDELVDETAFSLDVELEPLPFADDTADSGEATIGDTVRMYLHEIGRVPLLTGDQEYRLARQIEQGEKAKAKLKKLA